MIQEKRDFISMADFSADEIGKILSLARHLKKRKLSHELTGQTIGLIFQKPSTRTTVSFAVGVSQLGGNPLILTADALQIKRGESPKDTGRVLSRYLDAIVIRAHRHEDILEMASFASIPVINGLTDMEHPCQVMADLLTIMDKKKMSSVKDLKGFHLCYIGDGNNMAHSLMLASSHLGIKLTLACPRGYWPLSTYIQLSKKLSQKGRGSVQITQDPKDAVKGADAVYTDVWTSMGQEAEVQRRKQIFSPYQINQKLLKLAKKDSLVMHCLPAHRGEEITDDVIEDPHSVIFDQAENRLHAQKAILVTLLG
ncbi:MAG: ornithine carbamoyltransferase [Elusimicrobiota bacterium]